MAGKSAFGAKLSMSDMEVAPTFTEIASVVSISGPSLSLDTVDVTAHDSTNGWEEVAPTVLRSGELTLEVNYDPSEATHDATDGLPMAMETEELTNFKLWFPTPLPEGTEWAFAAYVTKFAPGAPHNGKLSASVGLKITGVPTLV